jgi:hypothetical protein
MQDIWQPIFSGAAMLPVEVGEQGFNAGRAHGILAPFVEDLCFCNHHDYRCNTWRDRIFASL